MRLAGGIKQSRPWVQIVTDAFNKPLSVSPAEQIGALGALVCGAVGTGEYADYLIAVARMTSFLDPLQPDPAQQEILRKRHEVFLQTPKTLTASWRAVQPLHRV